MDPLCRIYVGTLPGPAELCQNLSALQNLICSPSKILIFLPIWFVPLISRVAKTVGGIFYVLWTACSSPSISEYHTISLDIPTKRGNFVKRLSWQHLPSTQIHFVLPTAYLFVHECVSVCDCAHILAPDAVHGFSHVAPCCELSEALGEGASAPGCIHCPVTRPPHHPPPSLRSFQAPL